MKSMKNDKKLITVFTPTYNRAHILPRCYECLRSQTVRNFKWLIVDDGSKDNTEELVKSWIESERSFEIVYIKKDNGGLHTAYNVAVAKADTELFICLESDDIFTKDAMEISEKLWVENRDKGYVGIITLCKDKEGNLIGVPFPDYVKSAYYWEHRRIAKGDKQYIQKTEILKKVFPMPVFEGEKFFDPKYSFFAMDRYGPLLVTNVSFDIVDYQPGGLTDTVMYHYYNSPNSFAEYRKLYMQLPETSFRYLLRQNIHYVSSCCLAHKLGSAVRESPKKAYTVLCFIPGIIFAKWIRYYNRKRHS